jgi:transposase
MPRGKGRPSKCTPELIERISELIAKGMPIRLTCGAVGITDACFYLWMQKGEAGKKEYIDFFSKVEAAKAKAVEGYLDRLEEYSKNGSVYATTWFLERRCPEEFGRREKIDVKSENKNETHIDANVKLQPPEEIEQAILNKLARIRQRSDSKPTPEKPHEEGESVP